MANADGLRIDFPDFADVINISDVTGLPDALANPPEHTHLQSEITGLDLALGAKAPSVDLENEVSSRITADNNLQNQINLITNPIGGLSTDNPGLLWGLTLSNDADTSSLNIAPGVCADPSQSKILSLISILNKKINTNWAVGNANGGLDTGIVSTNWYHVWIIKRSDNGNVDALFSLSPTNPTMPANYDLKRRIGSVYYDGGFIHFEQVGDEFLFKTSRSDVYDSNPIVSTRHLRTLSIPLGIITDALIRVVVRNTTPTGNVSILVTPVYETFAVANLGGVPSSTAITYATGYGATFGNMRVRSDLNSQIAYVLGYSPANTIVGITTTGYIDTRGRI